MWFGDRIFWLRERFMRPENRTDVSCLADMNQPGLNDESYSLDFQRERVAWIVDHSGDGKVLDIGCGFGYILAERGMSGVGVDYDMARLSDALYRAEHPDEFPKWRGLQFFALDVVVVSPVHRGGCPTLHLKSTGDASWPSQDGAVVVDNDDSEPRESESARDGDRLMVGSLVKLTVTDEAEDASHSFGDPDADRCTHGEWKPVTE